MHAPASLQTFGGADLIFNDALHEYRLPLDGRIVPSVTTILRVTGMSIDFEELKSRSLTLAGKIDYKRALGTAAHADCHAFDDGDLDWSTVHADVAPYIEAWATMRENLGLTPTARERRVFHPTLFYCGTLDGIFRREADGRRILIDMKLGDPADAAADLQTAAYEEAYRIDHPDELVDERWSVHLVPECKIPYRTTNYSAQADCWEHFPKFQACVCVYHERMARQKGTR